MYPYSDPTSGQSEYQATKAGELLLKGQTIGFGGWGVLTATGYGTRKAMGLSKGGVDLLHKKIAKGNLNKIYSLGGRNTFYTPMSKAQKIALAGGKKRLLGLTAGRVAGKALLAGNIFMAAEIAIGVPVAIGKAMAASGQKRLLSATPQFHDLQEAYTERQRGIQALHNSSQNARSVLGREASLMHK